jgi:predicted anti-sigma-YlaC factor YlaD
MNCPQCEEALQRRLDGVPPADPAELDNHLALCPQCRARHAAVGRLEAGLRQLPAVMPPADLADRITGRVLAERRAVRRRRGLAAGAALAASVLLVVLLGRGRAPVQTLPVAGAGKTPPVEATPPAEESLRDSVREAGSAVVGLTRRTADETVAQGKLLLPVVAAKPSLGEGASQAMEPPVRSLQAAGQGVSEGLEPVTRSARRAFDLFLSELPPMGSEEKQGL